MELNATSSGYYCGGINTITFKRKHMTTDVVISDASGLNFII